MSAAVGAALKKIAVSLLTSKKGLKLVGGIILGIIIIVISPIAFLLAMFTGNLEMDTDSLYEEIALQMETEYQTEIESMENTIAAIENAMTAAGWTARSDEAKLLYLMELYEFTEQEGFVEQLIGCFTENQTDEQLVDVVNSTFGTEISVGRFSSIMNDFRAAYIDTSGYTNPAVKNNLDLVQWVMGAEKAGWGYVWGTYGEVLNSAAYRNSLNQYPEEVGGYAEFIEENWINKRTADCSGLIKGYCWLDTTINEISCGSHPIPGATANDMYANAVEKSAIDTIPEISGVAVWHDGHIGVYIGNGEVIEAMGTQCGVVKTKLEERGWTHWLKLSNISYVEQGIGTEAETQ